MRRKEFLTPPAVRLPLLVAFAAFHKAHPGGVLLPARHPAKRSPGCLINIELSTHTHHRPLSGLPSKAYPKCVVLPMWQPQVLPIVRIGAPGVAGRLNDRRRTRLAENRRMNWTAQLSTD